MSTIFLSEYDPIDDVTQLTEGVCLQIHEPEQIDSVLPTTIIKVFANGVLLAEIHTEKYRLIRQVEYLKIIHDAKIIEGEVNAL